MALAKKCDRCGKLYEYYPTGNKLRANAVRRCVILPSGGLVGSDNTLDLCQECMKAFDEFMIGGKFGND